MASEKTFRRDMCCMVFEDHRITASELEKECGKEAALDYYNAILDYSLYDIEPNLTGAVKFLWPVTKTGLDRSIENRSRGFRQEDTELTEKILQHKKDNPCASQRDIAKAVGCSVGKVNKSLNNTVDEDSASCTGSDANAYADSNLSSNTARERERERSRCTGEERKEQSLSNERTVYDLSDAELDEISRKYKAHVGYTTLCQQYNLPKYSLSEEVISQFPDIKKQHAEEREEAAGLELVERLKNDDSMLERISECSGFSAEDVLLHIAEVGEDADMVFEFFQDCMGEDSVFRIRGYENEFKEQYDTYWSFIKMGIDANIKNKWPSYGRY